MAELHRAAPYAWEWPPSSAQVSGGSPSTFEISLKKGRRRLSLLRPRRPTVVLKECFQELRGITRHVLPSTSTSTGVVCRFFHPKTGYYQQEYGSIFSRPDANPQKKTGRTTKNGGNAHPGTCIEMDRGLYSLDPVRVWDPGKGTRGIFLSVFAREGDHAPKRNTARDLRMSPVTPYGDEQTCTLPKPHRGQFTFSIHRHFVEMGRSI